METSNLPVELISNLEKGRDVMVHLMNISRNRFQQVKWKRPDMSIVVMKDQ